MAAGRPEASDYDLLTHEWAELTFLAEYPGTSYQHAHRIANGVARWSGSARHVLTENARVRQGAEALRAGDVATLGRLMSASHASSRDDFENSSPALDALIASAESSPGFLGGKLSGAGWAGCTVNLVSADSADAFASSVSSTYARRTGTPPDVHVCRAADGAAAIPVV